MRIIVTGAGGFVGRALAAQLAHAGCHVVAVDHALAGVRADTLIEGDIADPVVLAALFAGGCDAVVHLATVPGGAAERDPALARRVNVDATMALIDAAARSGACPRFVFASSIAVFGDPLPAQVDDTTPLAPVMLYGAHKAMMEQWIATQTRRGAIAGLSLRLPGIVARHKAPSGMKSAFMSDVFHALTARMAFVSPVSADATLWLMSRDCVVANIIHALTVESRAVPGHALTLPALRLRWGDLVNEIARQAGTDPALVSYRPNAALEAAFGAQPPLATPTAEALGFHHDGTVAALVASALATLH